MRLLFARVGIPHCPLCGREVKRQTVDQIVDQIMTMPERTRLQVLAPVVRARKGEHTKLLEQGMMHGIEVVNGSWYCPEAHRWCLEKKLTMFGNSDTHGPMNFAPGKHRTMTLVFARSATPEAIREALNERRTAVYHEEFIIGEEKYLKELFENALEWKVTKIDKKEELRVTVRNNSDLTFRLKKTSHDPRVIYFRNTSIAPFTIEPNSVQTFTVRLLDGIQSGDVNFIVENFLVEPDKGMRYTKTIKP
jgi:hypothetical protein